MPIKVEDMSKQQVNELFRDIADACGLHEHYFCEKRAVADRRAAIQTVIGHLQNAEAALALSQARTFWPNKQTDQHGFTFDAAVVTADEKDGPTCCWAYVCPVHRERLKQLGEPTYQDTTGQELTCGVAQCVKAAGDIYYLWDNRLRARKITYAVKDIASADVRFVDTISVTKAKEYARRAFCNWKGYTAAPATEDDLKLIKQRNIHVYDDELVDVETTEKGE